MIDVDMRKWVDRPHWRFSMQLLGRDDHGTWLGSRPPTAYTGPRGAGEWTHNFVVLVPPDEWWIATFNAQDVEMGAETYVDIATVATWTSGSHVTAIDLDLDVVRYWDGRVKLVDEDEFEEHRVRYSYPADVIDRALATSETILEAVELGREPFGSVGRTWLGRLE